MDKKTDSNIKLFIQAVANNNPGFVTAFLFGSYVRNSQTVDSDIDLALIIKNLEDADRFDFQVQLMMLASQYDTRIEPHPLSTEDLDSGNPFVHEILTSGIEIKLTREKTSGIWPS
jgi:predicted nucleotidyltransferase